MIITDMVLNFTVSYVFTQTQPYVFMLETKSIFGGDSNSNSNSDSCFKKS